MKAGTLALAALPSLALSAPALFKRNITTDASHVVDKSFDYIIAGGGLTGLTVASRLSEEPNVTVLVIEWGNNDENDPRVYDARTYGEAFVSDLDYNLTSTPISWRNGTQLPMVAGKTIGGSGSINGASWTKGPKSQYDLLPVLTGDKSWGWEGLNEYMLGAENFNVPTPEQVAKGAKWEPEYHRYGGRVEVSWAAGMFGRIQLPALHASTMVWKGLEIVADVASGFVNGATTIPNMLQSDVSQNRSSPYTAYIKGEPETRPNLIILTGHRVTKIHWRPNCNQTIAEGVEIQASRDSESLFVKTNREVLLAAGSLQSPQILELSGVGDPAILAAAGVKVQKSLTSVGKNLQEQTKNTVSYIPKNTTFNGTGPPSAITFPNVHQLLRDNSSAVYAEVMAGLPAYAAALASHGLVASENGTLSILRQQIHNLFNVSAAASEVFFTITPGTGQVGVDAWNLIPLARGYVHIRSNNSFDNVEIEPSYFGHPLDLLLQTASTMQSREVYETEPLKALIESEVMPGYDVVAKDAGVDVWAEWVKNSFTSVWHPIATLSMMKEELGGAVDSRSKVYGVENVRAIDASALPIQLSAHLSSSLYGIAEKAAAMIKEDARKSQA